MVDYVGVKNIGNLDDLVLLPIDDFKYLVNKGCSYSDNIFIMLVQYGLIDKIRCILDTGYVPKFDQKLFTNNKDIDELLQKNGIPTLYWSGNSPTSYDR